MSDNLAPIISAAEGYARRGWSVIPVKSDKRPAVKAWKSAQTVAARPADLAGWFGRVPGAAGVGIVLGAVSGGLYVRDFDDPESYRRWAEARPDAARSLPTVRTARGFHIYGRWEGVRTARMTDGELRGEGAYVVAPPSPTATAGLYAWSVALPVGDLLITDPAAVGLDRPWTNATGPRATERTERTEGTETAESLERTEDTEDTEDAKAISGELCGLASVQDAIARTLPKEYGRRNSYLFKLARALKAIPALSKIPPERVRELRPIVVEWHRRAQPNMLTQDFAVTWGDFAHAWGKVRHAEGADVLGEALRAAEGTDPPEWADDYSPPAKLLASLCRELQRRAGAEPFFVSAAKAGECAGVDKGTANRYLAAFVADGALRVECKGSAQSGRATRYRYIASDLSGSDETQPDQLH